MANNILKILIFTLTTQFIYTQQKLYLQFHKHESSLTFEFVKMLKDVFACENFIETGTSSGITASHAAKLFAHVYTVELNERRYEQAKARLSGNSNTQLFLNNSEDFLKFILSQIKTDKSLIYLDAHYSGGDTAFYRSNTPLLQELQIIKESNTAPVILIDNVRLFQPIARVRKHIAQEPRDANMSGYPVLRELEKIILEISPNYAFIVMGDICLAYCTKKYAHVQISPIIYALTTSKLYSEYATTKEQMQELLEAEKNIAQADSSSQDVLIRLITSGEGLDKPKEFTLEYQLWHALILMQNKKYQDSILILQELYRNGLTQWRIKWYLAKNYWETGNYMLCKVLLEDILTDCVSNDFKEAIELFEKVKNY